MFCCKDYALWTEKPYIDLSKQIYCHYAQKGSAFVSSDHNIFSQNETGLSMCSFANASLYKNGFDEVNMLVGLLSRNSLSFTLVASKLFLRSLVVIFA